MHSVLDYLRRYADLVLERYRDPYHGTPLFFDGFDTFTGRPVVWRNVDGTPWEPSNLASQQNFFRFLVCLARLTGDERYAQAARDAIAWHFQHVDHGGLLTWGGHSFIDLRTLRAVGPENKHQVHELKHHYPYYELMHEVDPQATARLIKGLWNAHIDNWDSLELSRHGQYGRSLDEPGLWSAPQRADLDLLREARGLSFINIGSDLIYAACMLFKLQGDEQALSWGEFLAWQYVRSRHPVTGLGVYQFNRPEKREEPPTDENAHNFTWSFFGDRAHRQFGPEYGDVAKEAWVLFKMDEEALNGPEGIYGESALTQMLMARELGEQGRRLRDWTLDGLDAWARYAYVPESNEIKPMFADGRDLTGEVFRRFGYYGPKGKTFIRRPITGMVFLSYATAWAVSRRATLWPTVCAMARNFGLGDWDPEDPAQPRSIAVPQDVDALLLSAVMEVHRATGAAIYLELAQKLGERMFAQRAHRGAIVASEHHTYCRLDDPEPLALALMLARLQGCDEGLPVLRGYGGYIHGDAMLADGTCRNIQDIKAIYTQTQA
ncbi:hypothetical protein [Uliginosibacterium sp. H1]|uniref:hypothetical protein n=1 Tax=Uliginosibacterium sp. H1 TaxID=3114757 RepID=UPI002E184C0C|nr:hypothetical protein [Uliginosibacterium sp. H1]